MTKKTFSIVVPVYQNESNLPSTVPKLLALAEALPNYHLELVLVEDGSRDQSKKLLEQFAALYPQSVKAVYLTRNFGQTPAIQAGLKHASGDCVGIISCDLQEPHERFVDMLGEWEKGALFVIGERVAREESASHQWVSSFYWRMVRKLAFPDFPRLGYDFCLLDRRAVNDINRINEKNSSIFVLIYWLGYRATRIPITRAVRESGKSQWRIGNKLSFTWDTLIGFTYIPARLISGLGFFLGCLCGLATLVSIYQRFVYNEAPAGWASIFVLVAFIGSVILFSLGILSEYLLRILDEARKRPPYVVERWTGEDQTPKP